MRGAPSTTGRGGHYIDIRVQLERKDYIQEIFPKSLGSVPAQILAN